MKKNRFVCLYRSPRGLLVFLIKVDCTFLLFVNKHCDVLSLLLLE